MVTNNRTNLIAYMKYRADIDGLRAIAVLLVIFYHAHLPISTAGFIGVDIFFVISGYLITGIIVRELQTSDHFSVLNFFKKRLWRLAPVFIALLGFTLLIGLIFFLPEDLMNLTSSAKNAAYFNANNYFAKTTQGYFSQNVNYLLLLHTWSLSIEWQWYGILPIVLIGFTRYFPKHYLMPMLGGLTLLAAAYAMVISRVMPEQNYYQLSARIFELLLGGLLVTLPFHQVKPNNSLLNHCIWGAIGSIAIGGLLYLANMPTILYGFPNQYAVLVCILTAILIVIGDLYPNNFCSRSLRFQPIVWVGLLSYSLYIWHWPIFATVRYLGFIETPLVTFFCIATGFVLGFCSWFFLENPARQFNQRANMTMTIVVLLLIPIVLTQGIHVMIKRNAGFPQRFGQEIVNIEKILSEHNLIGREKCMHSPNLDTKPVYPDTGPDCQLGAVFDAKNPPRTALMIGDSFANHYFGFMNVLARDANIQVRSNTTAGCLVLPDIYLIDWLAKGQIYQECYDNMIRYYDVIKNNQYDYVVVGQRWSGYLSDKIINTLSDERSDALSLMRMNTGLEQMIRLIIASGARPVILEETFVNPDDNACFYQSIKRRTKPNENYEADFCSVPMMLSDRQQAAQKSLRSLKERYPNLIVIDPKRVQCSDDLCLAAIQGIPIFSYGGHISDFASTQLGLRYLHVFGNPFSK